MNDEWCHGAVTTNVKIVARNMTEYSMCDLNEFIDAPFTDLVYSLVGKCQLLIAFIEIARVSNERAITSEEP